MSLLIPEALLRNPHFARYYRTWQKNEASIVFVPLAQICREQGLLNEARQICERGLQRHPDSVSGRLMLARIFFDQDDFPQARALVERVLEEFPGQPEAVSLLTRIRRVGGLEEEVRETASPEAAEEPVEAAQEAEEVTEVSGPAKPESVPLWENATMAKIYADQGETRIARQMIERILARQPDNEKALALKEELDR